MVLHVGTPVVLPGTIADSLHCAHVTLAASAIKLILRCLGEQAAAE